GNVDRAAFERGAAGGTVPAGTDWICRHKVLLTRRNVEVRRRPQHLTIEAQDMSAVGAAQPACAFGKGLEHCLQIERRTADDVEQLAGCCLLIERFAQFVEQACVFNGDHRLRGESGDQLDLFLGKGPDGLPTENDYADRTALAQQRNTEYGSNAADV